MSIENLITDHLETWTTAHVQKAAGGRGRGKKSNGRSLYGIKKLRELILELGVRGKLVPQDPNDEPASLLLEKIAEERDRLAKQKLIKRPKKLSPVSDTEKPFPLPNRWEYVRLNDLGEWGAGSTPSRRRSDYYNGNIPWFKSGELVGDLISSSEEQITELALKETSVRYNKAGDVLIAMYGATIGKTSILELPATTNQAVCACTPFVGFSNVFLFTLLKAYKSRFTEMGAGGAQPNISREKLIATVIALPPTAEQHLIVAKVDELMALCDKLEQEQSDNSETHQLLVKTLLDTLTYAQNHQDFIETWQQIEQNFDILFTTEASIDELKQTILQLAVMGKVVPQDPSDEPATILLEKITQEKARLVKEGNIKKQKPHPEISADEKPFELPNGYIFSRLQEAIDVRDGTHDSPKDATGADTYPLVTSKNFINGEIDFDGARRISEEDHIGISKRSQVDVDDILFSMIGGNLGNQVIVKDSRPFSVKNVALFKYYNKELTHPQFIKIFMEHLALDLQSQAAGGAQPFVSLGFLRNIVIGLPPINEQFRIVAKVNELMTLCDSIKENLNDAQTTQVQLADAIVGQAV